MPNELRDIMPRILAQALITLRENAIMPRLVNADYSNQAAEKGSVVNVPVPSRMTATDVLPGAYSQSTGDLQLDTVPIPLNNWKESAFFLTDRDQLEIMDGAQNMQVVEAARAIANEVDKSLLDLFKGVYNVVGTAGTTPMGSNLDVVLEARKLLNKNNALMSDRRVVLDVDAEAEALGLPAFQQYLQAGTDITIREGMIGRKLGFDWYLDQNITQHVAGTCTAATTTAAPATTTTADASNPQQHNPRTVYSVATDTAGNARTIKVGDVFTAAGDTQTYVVTANATSGASGTASAQTMTVSFSPAPKVTWNTGTVLTFRASHVNNLVFHRDAFGLAVRPLAESSLEQELGANTMTMIDPVTGIPLRLEVRREYKRVRWALDCLWGVGLVRPETAVRLLG
jgi:hypothetical protein